MDTMARFARLFRSTRWIAIGLGAASIVACGGATGTGGNGSGVGTGGDGSDAGSGAGGAGGGVGGRSSGAGGTSNGGSIGIGGALCACTAIGCPPGYHTVSVPGQCCPSCESCGNVDCAAPPCSANQRPVTIPGQCCPTSCMDVPGCAAGSPASCLASGNCTPTWSQAFAVFGTCDPPPTYATYLASCGAYHAIVHARVDGTDRYFYDASGLLVGRDQSGAETSCEAYAADFNPPSDDCVFEPHCGVTWPVDAGASVCGNGYADPYEDCDGANLKGATCASVTMGAFTGGTLKCSSTCRFDTSGCTR